MRGRPAPASSPTLAIDRIIDTRFPRWSSWRHQRDAGIFPALVSARSKATRSSGGAAFFAPDQDRSVQGPFRRRCMIIPVLWLTTSPGSRARLASALGPPTAPVALPPAEPQPAPDLRLRRFQILPERRREPDRRNARALLGLHPDSCRILYPRRASRRLQVIAVRGQGQRGQASRSDCPAVVRPFDWLRRPRELRSDFGAASIRAISSRRRSGGVATCPAPIALRGCETQFATAARMGSSPPAPELCPKPGQALTIASATAPTPLSISSRPSRRGATLSQSL
jgi:hypothetical protein